MDRIGPRILYPILLALLLAVRSDGSRNRALLGEFDSLKPSSSPSLRVGVSKSSNENEARSSRLEEIDPREGDDHSGKVMQDKAVSSGSQSSSSSDRGGEKKGVTDNAAPPIGVVVNPSIPVGNENFKKEMETPGTGTKDNKDAESTPQGSASDEKDKKDKDKAPQDTPRDEASQGPAVEEKDKKSKLPASPQEIRLPQSPVSGEEDKKGNAQPVGPEKKDKGGPSEQEHEEEKNTKVNTDHTEVQDDLCSMLEEKCVITGLVACIQYPGSDSEEPFLLVQNRGENMMTLKILAPPSIIIDTNVLELVKNSSKKVKFSTNVLEGVQITLDVGHGNCSLNTRPLISSWNPLQKFASAQVTPIYGAYFLLFAVVVAGGIWICCKFRRKAKRTVTGIPYQQLEMGSLMHSSVAEGNPNPIEGWDESWDDGWGEEEMASRPTDSRPTGNISTNGLTSRPSRKEGWEIDWDD